MKSVLAFFESVVVLFKPMQLKDDAFSTEVARAQQSLVSRNLSTIAILSIILSSALSLAMVQYLSLTKAVIWYAISLPIPIGQLIIARRYRKPKAISAPAPKELSGRLLKAAERNTLLYAMVWACVAPIFGTGNQEALLFATLIQVSMCTGLGMMIAPVPRMVMRYTLCSLVPLAIVLLISGTLLSMALSFLTCVLIGSIYAGGKTSHAQLKRIIGSETKTRQAETILRATLEAMPDAFALYNPSGDLILSNANHDMWNITTTLPKSDEGEHTYVRQGTQHFRHSWFSVPDIGTLSVHSDISAQQERENALMVAKRSAEIANGTRSRFLSRMSHELRTPLNSILGFSSFLSDADPQPAETVKEYSRFIRDSGQQLLHMIEDVIEYSKIGDDTQTAELEPVDIKDIIQQAIELAARRPGCQENKNYKIRVHDDAKMLMSDPSVLHRILAALISNAIKFSPNAPEIIITSRLLQNGDLMIIIRDFGKGMTKPEIANAFSLFYQADDSRRREQEGAGLGLALVRKLANRINAEIKVMSEVGRGTAIVIVFKAPVEAEIPTPDKRLSA